MIKTKDLKVGTTFWRSGTQHQITKRKVLKNDVLVITSKVINASEAWSRYIAMFELGTYDIQYFNPTHGEPTYVYKNKNESLRASEDARCKWMTRLFLANLYIGKKHYKFTTTIPAVRISPLEHCDIGSRTTMFIGENNA